MTSRATLPVLFAALLAGAAALAPVESRAGSNVSVGIGIGVAPGYYGGYGYRPYGGYYGGYGGYYAPRYYYPPPVVFVPPPPPAYYYPPPPPVYYAPPPAYYAPAPTVMLGSPPPSPGWQPGQTYCREWRGSAQIEGRVQEMYGTVCRQPDGSWRFQNN